MNLSIQLAIDKLEDKINQLFPHVIYEEATDAQSTDLLAIRVVKLKDIKIKIVNNHLNIKAPLSVWTKIKWRKQVPSIFKKIYTGRIEETTFDILVDYNVHASINQNWVLTTKTLSSFSWKRYPLVGVALVKMNIAPFLKPIVDREVKRMARKLDHFVRYKIVTQRHFQKAWQFIQQPILINKKVPMWLQIKPYRASASHIQCKNKYVRMDIQLDMDTKATLSDQPPMATSSDQISDLPPFEHALHIAPNFNTVVQFAVPFEQAEKTFTGQTIAQDGHSIQIHTVSLFKKRKKLGIKAAISGTISTGFFDKGIEGELLMTCRPYYDEAFQKISLKDISYEIKTNDSWLKIGNWFIKQTVKSEIQKQVSELLEIASTEAENQIETAIAHIQLNKHLILKGQDIKLTVVGVDVLEDALQVAIDAKGLLTLEVGNF